MPVLYPGSGAAFTTVVPVIGDGDKLDASVINGGLQRLQDQQAYVYRKVPKLYYSTRMQIGFKNLASTGIHSTLSYTNINTSQADSFYVDVPGTSVGDTIDIFASIIWNVAGVPTSWDYWVDAIDNATGTPGTQTHVPSAHFGDVAPFTGNLLMTFIGTWTVAIAGTTRFPISTQANQDSYVTTATIAAVRNTT